MKDATYTHTKDLQHLVLNSDKFSKDMGGCIKSALRH